MSGMVGVNILDMYVVLFSQLRMQCLLCNIYQGGGISCESRTNLKDLPTSAGKQPLVAAHKVRLHTGRQHQPVSQFTIGQEQFAGNWSIYILSISMILYVFKVFADLLMHVVRPKSQS